MRWNLRSPINEETVSDLAREVRISPLLSRLLVMRGIRSGEEAQRYLAPSLSHLHSPFQMLGMTVAVDRLRGAIERKEKTLIYGDYDVDGTMAVVILKTAIELCGGLAEFHVPHRIREGYGMRDEVIERSAADGVRLIISVDTGIRAFAAAETCSRLGLDLIVTDHHLPQSEGVPRAVAVLNPNQEGCGYPSKGLCGAGVAFKLAQALLEAIGQSRLIPSFLKIVAIATIADAVPLTGENRVFAKLGLDGLRSPVNPGLKALLDVAALGSPNVRPLTAGDVAFRLAPRLNAAGRMDVARDVVDLFMLKDRALAQELAERLNKLNVERQQEEARIITEIQEKIEADPELRNAYFIVVDGEGWHKGVIGIAATRIVERYVRPVLVISRTGEEAQGSGRSIQTFHLLEALESSARLFTRFGGHAHAAGFALPSSRISELRVSMNEWARTHLTPADLEPTMEYDAEIEFAQINQQSFQDICKLQPFGMGNPEPVFLTRGARLVSAPRMLKDKHVKMRVSQAGLAQSQGLPFRRVFNAMAWRMAERWQQGTFASGDLLDLAFTVCENSHPEFGGLELSVCDFVTASMKAVG